jgi:small subunit ribosomal protein S4
VARYAEPVCRLCRREGIKLFLKGARCISDKCAIDRRSYPPGIHGRGRGKATDYGLQLREKQKVKRLYRMMEDQFRIFFERASRKKGNAGENLLTLLERRLDTVTYRLGFARSQAEARQLVLHSHVLISGRVVNIPSFIVRESDVVEIKPKDKNKEFIQDRVEGLSRRGIPSWLSLDPNQLKAQVIRLPSREDVPFDIKEQLVVELYSK